MRRLGLALLLAAVAAAVAYFDPLAEWSRASLAAVTLPRLQTITAIETTGAATPLDAALVLRAVLRYGPKSVAFLDPLAGDDGMPLLISKLGDARMPVEFAADTKLPRMARVATLPAMPSHRMDAFAGRYVERVTLDQVMIRTERSERGEIAIALDNLFRNRVVAVETTGGQRSARFAAALNGLAAAEFPPAGWAAVLIAATLPWWRAGRFARAFAALGVTCACLLLALSVYAQFHVAIPLTATLLLPFLALIPPGRA
jgi:hypothetical protein